MKIMFVEEDSLLKIKNLAISRKFKWLIKVTHQNKEDFPLFIFLKKKFLRNFIFIEQKGVEFIKVWKIFHKKFIWLKPLKLENHLIEKIKPQKFFQTSKNRGIWSF